MSRPSYRRAVEWLALHAYPHENSDDYADQCSMHLVAHLFDTDKDAVARDAREIRESLRGKGEP